MKQRLENMNVENKRVIVRCDFNVPIKNGKILDDAKIKRSLETIHYLIKNNAKIILLSHLGKINTETDKVLYSLKPVADVLKKYLNTEVYFSKQIIGPEVVERVNSMQNGEILLLENTRFLDVPGKLESNCDIQVSQFLASLGDLYVNDAFASSHRSHASITGIPKFIPSCLGFSTQQELIALDKFLINPKRPFVVIMGGAKVEDKLKLIKAMLEKCDYLLLAGGLANSFLKSLKINIGSSLATDSSKTIKELQQILLNNRDKIMLPLDAIVGSTYDEHYARYKKITEIDDNDCIMDIGTSTIVKYRLALRNAETIFVNGTVGVYEDPRFSNGTRELLTFLSKSNAITVFGGGDSVSSVHHFGFDDQFTYLSTGGGATLEYLINGHLVGIDAIKEAEDIEVLNG